MVTIILRLPTVETRVGLSRSSIYLRISEHDFPKPVSLGGRAVGWIESEVEDWLNQKIEASRAAPATSGRLNKQIDARRPAPATSGRLPQ